MARRFLQAFQAHGVEASQIQRFVPELSLACLQSEQELLAALTHRTLARTADFFGIRLAWLEGVDDQIYEPLGCYKQPKALLDDLSAIVRGRDVGLRFPLRVVTSQMNLDCRDGGWQMLVPVLVEKIAELNDVTVCRYRVYADGFTWDYWPARMELKSIARIVFRQLHTPVPLFHAPADQVEALVEGRLFPGPLVGGCPITNPSLEDFALSRTESFQAKEEEELPEVLRYIDECGLAEYSFPQTNELTLTPVANEAAEEEGAPPAQDQALPPERKAESESQIGWKASAWAIADELDAKDAAAGAYSSVRDIASRVAGEMRAHGIYGPRGPLSEGTILREALQGKKWQRKRTKI